QAIDRELASAARDDELTLEIQCPDAQSALVTVAMKSPAMPLARHLDLGEVPSDLRVKLLAVAAAELIAAARAPREDSRDAGNGPIARTGPAADKAANDARRGDATRRTDDADGGPRTTQLSDGAGAQRVGGGARDTQAGAQRAGAG